MDSESLGQRIRRIRKEKALPLRMVSGRAGISVAYLSKIERDEANPTIDVLTQVAGVLQVNLDELAVGAYSQDSFSEKLPESLESFIKEYAAQYPELKEADWQKMLSSVRLRGRYPEESDDWLMIFLEARRAFK